MIWMQLLGWCLLTSQAVESGAGPALQDKYQSQPYYTHYAHLFKYFQKIVLNGNCSGISQVI